MHLLNLFKAFSGKSSSHDPQSAGEAEISIPVSPPSNSSSRKGRRLKRRVTKQPGVWQPEEVARKGGFRSEPNLLAETYRKTSDNQSRSWSPIPTLQRTSAPTTPYSRLRENFSNGDSWKSYDRNASPIDSRRDAQPPLDEQLSDSMESPVFGPREEGLFRNEMPYDMDSPLSQLASGWRESPRYMPRTASPDPQIPDPQDQSQMAYDTRPRSKEFAAEWRHFPESRPLRPTFSPEPSLRHVYEERHGPDPGNGTYYIVPGGMNVVFQDKTGNEITRVGDFSGRRRRISPIIVQDEYGRELYRTSDVQNSNRTSHPRDEPIYHRSRRTRQDEGLRYDTSRHSDSRSRSAEPPRDRYFQRSDSERSYSREPPTIVLIDGSGRQIPIMPRASEHWAPPSE